MSDLCGRCTRPLASEEDWERYGEGEGDHLCWYGDPTGSLCEVDPPADQSWKERAQRAEARLEEARKVFRPFLRELDVLEAEWDVDDCELVVDILEMEVTVGDLRALAKLRAEEVEGLARGAVR